MLFPQRHLQLPAASCSFLLLPWLLPSDVANLADVHAQTDAGDDASSETVAGTAAANLADVQTDASDDESVVTLAATEVGSVASTTASSSDSSRPIRRRWGHKEKPKDVDDKKQ